MIRSAPMRYRASVSNRDPARGLAEARLYCVIRHQAQQSFSLLWLAPEYLVKGKFGGVDSAIGMNSADAIRLVCVLL